MGYETMTANENSAFRVLRESDLKAILNVPTAMEIIERTFFDYGAGDTQRLSNPPSLFVRSTSADSSELLVKGATLTSERITGIRLVSYLPSDKGRCSYHLLCVFDDRTARPIGLVDETWLHRFRTAITCVVTAKYLARSESRTATLVGAGAIAAHLFPALTQTFVLDEVRVVARRFESAQSFCQRFQDLSITRLVPIENPVDALDGADIVITLTNAEAPVVHPGMLAPGSFICSMGETEEVHFDVLEEIDRFIVDDFEYATVLGDIAVWIKTDGARREKLKERLNANIGEIICGKVAGRQRPDERVYAIIQGMAICDLALAHHALLMSTEMGLGDSLCLFERP